MAVDKLDLKKFIKNGGKIEIPFNTNIVPKEKLPEFLGFWFFVDKNHKVIFIDQSTNLMYGSERIDINTIYKHIMETRDRWNIENPEISFPDIVISKTQSKITYALNEDSSWININIHDLFDQFDFTLHHELGHLHYSKKVAQRVEDELKDKSFSMEFRYVKWTVVSLFLLIAEVMLIKNPVFLFLTTLMLIVSTSFTALNFYATRLIPQKLKNFSTEFYADFYAKKYATEKSAMSFYLTHRSILDSHSFTHPSIKSRKREYLESKALDHTDWKSPVLNNESFSKNTICDLLVVYSMI